MEEGTCLPICVSIHENGVQLQETGRRTASQDGQLLEACGKHGAQSFMEEEKGLQVCVLWRGVSAPTEPWEADSGCMPVWGGCA